MLSPDRSIAPRKVVAAVADVLSRIRARSPRVHCITNVVAQNFSANMLLAVGAIPSMTIAPDEVGEFVARADALLINLGTFDAERRKAAGIAIDAIAQRERPWLLDPVFVERSQPRTQFAKSLLAKKPTAIRLNRPEFAALAGVEFEESALAKFSDRHNTVVGLTGETDVVTEAGRQVRIANGHQLMTKVTAMGCAGGALVGACLAVESDAWLATVSGLLVLGIAGQIAAEKAVGPGSLAVGILDAVYALDGATLIARARVA
ncbi:MAG: hydroxyethylthiazole kinase [Xanthobacteraceae bacterium]